MRWRSNTRHSHRPRRARCDTELVTEPAQPRNLLAIGEVAERAGISVPAVRYYEERGLIRSQRSSANQRRFPRHVLRRLAVISAGQRMGLSLREVGDALAVLPADRAPTRAEWSAMSADWSAMVAGRIRGLQALQQSLDSSIGCGCLSLDRCGIFNAGDEAAAEGPGSRWERRAREISAAGNVPS
ncbi:redox-sensitive transcriptional activator SoxR [Arthrobacter zhangbolii]|uniref:Redox-sensitive transcriptional activator SoxR n=1 Tax=Arthrobacter zhangbolii TaxID=2886936 RepID=A0A9X1M775_9MICC|nr:redox-sensitive transcriptional activator SoxR [Arthrobacter zhangbolii]MCC3272150.1 redox-sensitive transcriptional activator SoxR [Arthrobacter zhangbolii]UON91976.1 redox-sensitive transcriptional activator SoxR [Arthrobacter zhangbolii]